MCISLLNISKQVCATMNLLPDEKLLHEFYHKVNESKSEIKTLSEEKYSKCIKRYRTILTQGGKKTRKFLNARKVNMVGS